MLPFPITHISGRGPNKPGDVRFLESVPDYQKATERKRALEIEHHRYDIVIYRMSRASLKDAAMNGNRKVYLSRELPKGANRGLHLMEPRGLTTINYSLYAISKKARLAAPTSKADPLATKVAAVTNGVGQQGDPSGGGTHFVPPPPPPGPGE
jgi:hypothetical protein